MTRAEYYMNRRDEQTRAAIACFNLGDITGATMHRNIAKGFQVKLEKLSADECRMTITNMAEV